MRRLLWGILLDKIVYVKEGNIIFKMWKIIIIIIIVMMMIIIIAYSY